MKKHSFAALERSVQVVRLWVLIKIRALLVPEHLLYLLLVVQIALRLLLLLKVWPVISHRHAVRVERQYLQLFVLVCAPPLRR